MEKGSRSHSGSGCTARANVDEDDTAISPSKPRWSSSKRGQGGLKLAEKIHKQRQEEEEARKAREIAFDAGLIGPGGVLAKGAEHVILHETTDQEVRGNLPGVSSETGQSFDLNSEPIVTEGCGSGMEARGEEADGSMSVGVTNVNGLGNEDDPFELAPIIEAVMKEKKGRKRGFSEMESSSISPSEEPKGTRLRKSLPAGAVETSRKGSPKEP